MSRAGIVRIIKNVVPVGISAYVAARSAGLNNTQAAGAAASAVVVNLIGLFQVQPHKQ